MEKDINKMIEDGFKLAQKHEQIREEMLSCNYIILNT